MMKRLTAAALLATGLLVLTACGGKGDDSFGDNVAATYENKADALDAQADNLEAQADRLRDEGDRKEEAIDDSDVDATALHDAQKAEFANRQ